jgi:Flp pilus assembly protein TadG
MTRFAVAHCLRALAKDTRGTSATIFAISSMAICGMFGLSIDVARWVLARQTLQTSLDGAVIAMAASRQTGADAGVERLSNFVTANWKRPHGATAATLTFSEPMANAIEATAASELDTYFARIFGLQKLNIGVASFSRFGLVNSEVALVLDTTGSMAGARLDTLKTVSKKMIDDVYSVAGADTKVKFSVVPFGQYVNVGTQYRSASWLSVPNDGPQTTCGRTRPVTSKTGCSTNRVAVQREGQPTTYQDAETCQSYTYGPEIEVCGTTNNLWNGCVGSRASPLNASVMANNVNPVPGLPNLVCSSPLSRLSYNKVDHLAAVDALSATGETYIPSGLMWGWRTLAPDMPFQDGAPRTGGVPARKVLVLMTDGENTRSQSGSAHDGTDQATTTTLSSTLCTSIKADGVEIFTIAFDVTAGATLDMLRTCATSGDNFFDVKDSTRLEAAFKTIGDSLTIARLVK